MGQSRSTSPTRSTFGTWLIQERSLRDGGERDTIKEHKETSCQGRKTISKVTGRCTPREHKVRGQPVHTLIPALQLGPTTLKKILTNDQQLACYVSPRLHSCFLALGAAVGAGDSSYSSAIHAGSNTDTRGCPSCGKRNSLQPKEQV